MADPPLKVVPLEEDIAAMAFVQSSFLCQGLAEEMLAQLFSSGQVLEYDTGAMIFDAGSVDDGLYVVLEGSVNIRKRQGEADIDLVSFDRQSVFGEGAVLTRRPRAATAVARVETRLIRFAGGTVRQIAEGAPRFGRKLAALMAGRNKEWGNTSAG